MLNQMKCKRMYVDVNEIKLYVFVYDLEDDQRDMTQI